LNRQSPRSGADWVIVTDRPWKLGSSYKVAEPAPNGCAWAEPATTSPAIATAQSIFAIFSLVVARPVKLRRNEPGLKAWDRFRQGWIISRLEEMFCILTPLSPDRKSYLPSESGAAFCAGGSVST
jgi:hypothetical protein